MKALLDGMLCITEGTNHHAFTDLCLWKGQYWCAYRIARTHNIVPKGVIHLEKWKYPFSSSPYEENGKSCTDFTHEEGDMRDPRFFVTPEVLYLYCGIYLPHPAYATYTGAALSPDPGSNILMTHVAYTTDGKHWSDMSPLLRPNYWGWSVLSFRKSFYLASYHTGILNEEGSSIMLWKGSTPFFFTPIGVIYNNDPFDKDMAFFPSEPLLSWSPESGYFECYLRTENGMDIGISGDERPGSWRWVHTNAQIHPSAILRTQHGVLVAARTIHTRKSKRGGLSTTMTTDLYRMSERYPEHLLTLPSDRDTGYCGLEYGKGVNEILLSYYSQHEMKTHKEPLLYFTGAQVYLARIILEA